MLRDVAFSVIDRRRRASIRWMRPRGESISSCQSTYVGHVGRQNPQWTQSAVSSRITRRAPLAGRAPGGASTTVRTAAGCPPRSRAGRRRPTPGARSPPGAKRERLLGGRGRSGPAPGRALTRARLVPSAPSSAPPTSERAAASCASTARSAPSKRTTPGMEDVERARLEREPRSASTAEAGSSVSTTSVPVARGSGWSRKLARAIAQVGRRSRRRAVPGHSPRRSSPPCPPHSRRYRRRARSHAQDEVARCSEAVSQQARGASRERPDRRVPPRRVEREPLPVARRPSVERRARPGLDRAREVARLVFQDLVEAVRGQVAAILTLRPCAWAAASSAEACSTLETLGNARPLEHVRAVGPRDLAAQARCREDLHPGCRAPPDRIAPDAREGLEVALEENILGMEQALSAVLAGQRSAASEQASRITRRGRAPARSLPHRRRRGRCRLPSPRGRRSPRSPCEVELLDAPQDLGQPGARHDAVLDVVVGRDATHRGEADFRPLQRRARAASSEAVRISNTPGAAKMRSTSAASSSTCTATPSSSTSRTAPAPAGWPATPQAPRPRSSAGRIISIAEGIPAATMPETAAPAASVAANPASSVRTISGARSIRA